MVAVRRRKGANDERGEKSVKSIGSWPRRVSYATIGREFAHDTRSAPFPLSSESIAFGANNAARPISPTRWPDLRLILDDGNGHLQRQDTQAVHSRTTDGQTDRQNRATRMCHLYNVHHIAGYSARLRARFGVSVRFQRCRGWDERHPKPPTQPSETTRNRPLILVAPEREGEREREREGSRRRARCLLTLQVGEPEAGMEKRRVRWNGDEGPDSRVSQQDVSAIVK